MNPLSSDPKALFDLPPPRGGMPVVDLRSLTHGAPPKAVRQNIDAFYAEWVGSGVDAWNSMKHSADIFCVGDEDKVERQRNVGWWNLPEVIGDRFISRLLHAPTGTCIMLPNATQIVFGILSCKELHTPGRRKIICTDGEFPAVLHSIQNANMQFAAYPDAIRNAVSFENVIVEMQGKPFDAQHLIEQIDESTALVIFSHVGFTRGERVSDDDIRSVAQACHAHGALLAIDGYHAIGAHRTDVQLLDTDFYFGGLLKEGCGSSSNCFLYIRESLDVHPSLSGWFGDRQPFAFDTSPDAHGTVRRRFLTGTTPIAPLYHGIEGVKIMLNLGLDAVADDILGKVETMVDILTDAGVSVVSPTSRDAMSAMIVIEVSKAEMLREFLDHEHGILTDARKNKYLRFAPHIYITLEEAKRSAQTIAEAISSGTYTSHSYEERKGPVT